MKIEMMNINDVIPYKGNPRHNDNAVEYVRNSIEEFGFKVPIIIDEHNIIVAGHTRLKAAKELDLKNVPIIRADDLDDEQIKAFRLADNKVAEFSEWDFKELVTQLNEIEVVDMDAFGFEDELPDLDLDGIFEEQEPVEEDDNHYLTWDKHKVFLSEHDRLALNNKHEQFEDEADQERTTFIEWLFESR